MRVELVHIKAATAGERIGTLQCLNGFIRKRIMEHLEKLEGALKDLDEQVGANADKR